MNYPFISAFLTGCSITTGLIGSYLIHRKGFNLKTWSSTSLFAIGIGVLFTQLLCAGFAVFSTSVAVTIAAIIYFGAHTKQNETLEQTLVSALGGVLIGMISLVGFIMCC
jgi:hypothetical protein